MNLTYVFCGLYLALIGFTCGLSPALIGVHYQYPISHPYQTHPRVRNLSIGIRAMTTQKECIEKLEIDVHEIKESIQRLEQSMKETIVVALKEAMAFASIETKAKPPH
jgi:hypothetical protein